MTPQDATSDYIDFLRKRGSISHVISAPPGASLSTLALTQRCLANGIAFPVPLPDGSVAVNVQGEIPSALAALGLVIEPVSAEAEPDPAPRNLEADVAEDDPLGDVQPWEAEAPGAVEEGDDWETVAVTDETSAEAPTQEPDPGRGFDESLASGPEANEPEDETVVDPMDAESAEVTQFPVAEPDDDPVDHLAAAAETEPDPEPAMPEEESAVETVAEDVACEQYDLPAEGVDSPEPDVEMSTPGGGDALGFTPVEEPRESDRMQEVLDVLMDLEVRIDSLATEQSQLAAKFAAFSRSLEIMAAKPVPRPDATEFNRGMARVTSAVAHSIRRLDEVLDAVASGAESEKGADMSGALSSGLMAIAEAVKGTQGLAGGAGGAGQPDLPAILAKQDAISQQLAELIETRKLEQPLALEEFMLDLRHATAELFAEQARLARAG